MDPSTRCHVCEHPRSDHSEVAGCLSALSNLDYCTCPQFVAPPLVAPETPYAGTSGWSGSDTSRERAERDDVDGTSLSRQQAVLAALNDAQSDGLTWRELAQIKGYHHGQASGALSVLHKTGRIERLAGPEGRRNRCAVYVLPAYVNGRETAPQGRQRRRKPSETLDVSTAIFEALGAASVCWENPAGAGEFDSERAAKIGHDLLDRLDALL